MKPQIGVITLAVENLERALAFYRALGLKSPGTPRCATPTLGAI